MLCISALVFRKINQMTAEHGPGLLDAVAGLSLFSAYWINRREPPRRHCLWEEATPSLETKRNRQRDITPEKLYWSIGREG